VSIVRTRCLLFAGTVEQGLHHLSSLWNWQLTAPVSVAADAVSGQWSERRTGCYLDQESVVYWAVRLFTLPVPQLQPRAERVVLGVGGDCQGASHSSFACLRLKHCWPACSKLLGFTLRCVPGCGHQMQQLLLLLTFLLPWCTCACCSPLVTVVLPSRCSTAFG